MDNIRTRSFRLMLYPDNRDHMKTFKFISRDTDYKRFHAGIWHTRSAGKKHLHLLLRFESPRSWYQILKSSGADPRFCRPVGYEPDKKNPDKWHKVSDKRDSWIKACAYLPHFTDPEKEQYSVDDIFGFPLFVDGVKKNAMLWQSRSLSQADCLLAARAWICSNFGKYITTMMVVKWLTASPYMRIANSVLFRNMIIEHNETVLYNEGRQVGWDAQEAKMKYEERIEFRKELEAREFEKNLREGTIKLEDFEVLV